MCISLEKCAPPATWEHIPRLGTPTSQRKASSSHSSHNSHSMKTYRTLRFTVLIKVYIRMLFLRLFLHFSVENMISCHLLWLKPRACELYCLCCWHCTNNEQCTVVAVFNWECGEREKTKHTPNQITTHCWNKNSRWESLEKNVNNLFDK